MSITVQEYDRENNNKDNLLHIFGKLFGKYPLLYNVEFYDCSIILS